MKKKNRNKIGENKNIGTTMILSGFQCGVRHCVYDFPNCCHSYSSMNRVEYWILRRDLCFWIMWWHFIGFLVVDVASRCEWIWQYLHDGLAGNAKSWTFFIAGVYKIFDGGKKMCRQYCKEHFRYVWRWWGMRNSHIGHPHPSWTNKHHYK